MEFAFRCQVGPQQREMMYSRIEGFQRRRDRHKRLQEALGTQLEEAEGGSGNGGSRGPGQQRNGLKQVGCGLGVVGRTAEVGMQGGMAGRGDGAWWVPRRCL